VGVPKGRTMASSPSRVRSPGAWAQGSSVKRFVPKAAKGPPGVRGDRGTAGGGSGLWAGDTSASLQFSLNASLGSPSGGTGAGDAVGPLSPENFEVVMEDGTPRVRACALGLRASSKRAHSTR
jgi:hypothetical protein